MTTTMMESMVEVPPDDGGPIAVNNLSLSAPWTETESAASNSNILYIAVEYVKDNDFKLQSDTVLSPQPVYTEFDQHVSALDPNMSSVARYSPVYTSEGSSTYRNPVVVTQLVGNDSTQSADTPLVEDAITNNDLQQVVSNQYLQMVTNEQNDVVDNNAVDGMQMVPDAEQEVDILITDQSTGISYLVERCLADDSQLLDPDSLLDSDLLSLDENTLKTQLSEIIIEPSICEANSVKLDGTDLNSNIKPERRSQRLSCNTTSPETEEQLLSCVQQICDRPILSRARASLPESHLVINKNQNGESGVFAKKFIPKRTQFGPIEGVLLPTDNIKEDCDQVHLSIESNGVFQKLDVSNENVANWMCFVQLAYTYGEQNLVVTQQDNNLYYTTTKNIHPKQELLVGYGVTYAQTRNLKVLEPHIGEEDLWSCYECSATFVSSQLLQKHLDEHDDVINQHSRTTKKKKKRSSSPQIGRNEYLQCTVCLKIFSSQKFCVLRQHLSDHGLDSNEQLQDRFIIAKSYNCEECDSSYIKEEDLITHAQEHHGDVDDPLNSSSDLSRNECDAYYIKDEELMAQKQEDVDDALNTSSESCKMECESPKMEYKCPVCYKTFASGERIQKHMLVHGAEESKPLQCDKCCKRFLNNSALACHLKTHLLGRKVFECPICKESFHHVLQLKLHVPKHCVDGHYTCPHCSKLFEKYSIIRKHIRAFHCERKHSCPDCSKPFPTLDKLRMHLLKHSDHREFLCADCGKQFKRKDKLKEHCKRMHSEERENAMPRGDKGATSPSKKFTPKVQPTDYHRFIYKCHTCLVGFKRRGMLVNHLAKRHPDISPDSVPELNLPILRATKDYYCNYCDKVYKSSSKRKAHILKNHPGAALPLSNRRLDSSKSADLPNPTFSQTVGSVTTHPQACLWCHKQYASKAKLLQHQRKKHADLLQQSKQNNVIEVNEDIISDIVQQDGHYYQLVSMDDPQFAQNDLNGDSRLYRLLTTGNNLVPPR